MERKTAALAILGSYPPPYGGVTIHTRRLCTLLEQRKVDYIVYNAASQTENGERVFSVYRMRHLWLLWYALFGKEPVIYIMSPRLMSWMLGAFMAWVRGKKVILRIQNSRLIDWCGKTSLRKSVAKFSLCRISEIISVNREIHGQLIQLGVNPERAHIFPGFLPPVSNDFSGQTLSREIWDFLEKHRPVIAANGKISFYQGEDLYGLDHLIELAIQLKPEYPDLGIIFCFSDFSLHDQDYLDKLISKAADHGISDNILFNTKGGPFLPVLKKSDLFVRPTNTDGDANSIREAQFLGIPTVASNAVGRPEGVTLFESRNLPDFVAQVSAVLSRNHEGGKQDGFIDSETHAVIGKYVELLTTASKGNSL